MNSILLHLAISFATLGIMELIVCLGVPIHINKIYGFIPILNVLIIALLLITFVLVLFKKVILIKIADGYFICLNHKTDKALGFFTDKLVCIHINNMNSFRSYLKKNINNKRRVLEALLTCRIRVNSYKQYGNINLYWSEEHESFMFRR